MEFNDAYPIYRQIIDDFKKKIVRGELKPGDKVPSQREYALKARVNPNTVQRAYREMEVMRMVETQRGQGTFVSVTPETVSALREEMAGRLLQSFISEMRSLGFNDQEMVEMVKRYQQHSEEGQR